MAGYPIEIPTLSEDVIITSINEFVCVPFTLKDLRDPTYEKLFPVYGAFVCYLLEMSTEQLTQIPLHVMETIYHKELHIEAGAGNLLFVKTLTYVMQFCYVDFKISDLVTPTRKGTRKLLSAIVNFLQFILRYNRKEDVLAKVAKIKEDQEKYFRIKEELPEIINSLKSRRLERQRDVQNLNLNAMKSQCEEIDAKKKEMAIKNGALKAEVEEMQNILTVAQSSCVIQELKEELDSKKSLGNTLISKEQSVSAVVSIAPSVYQLILDSEKDLKTCDILSNDLEKLDDRSLILSKQLKVISAEMHNIESLINGKFEKSERLASKYVKLTKIVEDTKRKLLDKVLIATDDIKSKEEQINKMNDELKSFHQLNIISWKDHENVIKHLNKQCEQLTSKVIKLNDLILNECTN